MDFGLILRNSIFLLTRELACVCVRKVCANLPILYAIASSNRIDWPCHSNRMVVLTKTTEHLAEHHIVTMDKRFLQNDSPGYTGNSSSESFAKDATVYS